MDIPLGKTEIALVGPPAATDFQQKQVMTPIIVEQESGQKRIILIRLLESLSPG